MVGPPSEPVAQSIDNTYRALGRFFYEFSRLEHAMRDAIHSSTNVDYGDYLLITASLTAQPLADAFFAICDNHQAGPDATAIFKSLGNEIDKLIARRNDFAHGTWWVGYGTTPEDAALRPAGLFRTKPSRKTAPLQFKTYAVVQLEELADRIVELQQYVKEIELRVLSLMPLEILSVGDVLTVIGGQVTWKYPA